MMREGESEKESNAYTVKAQKNILLYTCNVIIFM